MLHKTGLKLKCIDGQVGLVRLQTYNFRGFFFSNTQANDKLLFACWANRKRIKENWLGFCFPFDLLKIPFFHVHSRCLHVHVSMFMSPYLCLHVAMYPFLHFPMSHVYVSVFLCLHLHVSVSPCLHVSMSICLNVSGILQTENETKGKRQLPFICCKQKTEMTNCRGSS